MEVTEGSFRLDLQAVFADDERGVALVVSTASRGGRNVEVNDAHVFRLHDGRVVEFWNASTNPYAYDELLG
jgi:ketosteroid isomerase-like protein